MLNIFYIIHTDIFILLGLGEVEGVWTVSAGDKESLVIIISSTISLNKDWSFYWKSISYYTCKEGKVEEGGW